LTWAEKKAIDASLREQFEVEFLKPALSLSSTTCSPTMPGKHDLSDAEDDPSTPQQSSSKRSRRKSNRSIDQDQGSPLPGSSPPPNAEDDDGDEEEEEDPMSDIEPQDQEAIDRMRATQAIKSNVRGASEYTLLA
jgi:hypothetical protein